MLQHVDNGGGDAQAGDGSPSHLVEGQVEVEDLHLHRKESLRLARSHLPGIQTVSEGRRNALPRKPETRASSPIAPWPGI